MYQQLQESEGPLVALKLSATLTEEDYRGIVPLLESKIAEHGKIALVWELIDFSGWTAKGLWADTKFDLKHRNDFTRIAIVGEKKWHETMTQLMKPFTSAEVRFFDGNEREAAILWVQPGECGGAQAARRTPQNR